MRDLIVVAIVFGAIPFAYRRPFIGLLVFSWLAYMRPQDLCWGFARSMRLSFVAGLVMMIGYFASDFGRRPFYRKGTFAGLIIALGVFVSISLFTKATVIDKNVTQYYFEFLKVLAVALFTTGQVDSKQRIRMLLWVITLSLGFFGFKAGLWGLLTGGQILRGPGGMLTDNNDFALAMVMNLPLLFYLGRTEDKVIVRRFCDVAFVCSCVTVLLTHSRGGFLSMVAVALLLAYRSGKLFRAVAGLGVAAVLFFAFTPAHVFERLATLQQGTAEGSAGARWRSWTVALRMIEDNPILGVGLRNFEHGYVKYGSEFVATVEDAHVAHNSYLQIWAEAGSLAFLAYLGLLVYVFHTSRRVRRASKNRPEFVWAHNYARMFEVTTAGFCIGAIFLNRGHFDLLYQWIALVCALGYVFEKELAESKEPAPAATAPREKERLRILRRPFTPDGLPTWSRST